MKIINLNESQYDRLFEAVTDSDFGKNSNPEFYDQTKVTTQPKLQDGDADPMTSDDFADIQTPQQWGSVGGRRSSNTI